MPQRITSAQNPRIKSALRLRRRRGRRGQQRILIDGEHETLRAWQHGAELLEVFVCDPPPESNMPHSDTVRDIVAAAERKRIPVLSVSASVFARLTYADRLDRLVAVARPPLHTLESLALPACPLLAVLERVEKPGNIGAVARSADAAGVHALLLADCPSDPYNPNAIRASRGTIFTLPVVDASADTIATWLHHHDIQIVTTRVDSGECHTTIDYTQPTALVLGSEALGVSPCWSRDRHRTATVPMLGVGDSLNVAATAAVLFYEALRQRQNKGSTGP